MGPASFEFFVAKRYLRAKRKNAAISLITVISIVGVAAGVMALVIALAINNGFRNNLQESLLGATAHINLVEKTPGEGIADWQQQVVRLRELAGVAEASGALYGTVILTGPQLTESGVLKGLDVTDTAAMARLTEAVKQGEAGRLAEQDPLPAIVLGAKLAERTGMVRNSVVNVINPAGELTPFGPRPLSMRFRVVGIVETGFYDIDANWAFASLQNARRILGVGDVVNAIELRLDDIYQAPRIATRAAEVAGASLVAQTWMESNRQILNALRLEKVVTVITISLIQMVAALNIFIVLVMLVMEKHRDIALLMSMGAKSGQIRRIFILQGLLIAVVGVVVGLAAGYTLSFLADTYRWIELDAEVYALSYVPFAPRWADAFWIAGITLLVSFLATLHPAGRAAKIPPAEALRYE
ncbi:MAG: ABC transporter permease [Bryobacterales bacterium]|nr:ABC transporter permease [Bryobacterales bacterium]